MQKNKFYKTGVVTLALLALGSSPVFADTLSNDNDNNSRVESEGFVSPLSVPVDVKSPKKTVKTPFTANIVIKNNTNLDGKIIKLSRPDSLRDELDKLSIKMEDYETSGGMSLDDDFVIKNGDTEIIRLKSLGEKIEKIALPKKVEFKEDPQLPEGEEKVSVEGSDGIAIKTTKDDGSVKITIIKTPETSTIIKGTKKTVEPVETVESERQENQASPEVAESNQPTRSASSDTGSQNLPQVLALPAPLAVANKQTTVPPNSVPGNAIVATAMKHLGKAYVWGGESDAEGGFDCSGLVQSVFKENGYNVPRVTYAQGAVAKHVPLNQLQPGDILWNNAHVGIYIGNGKMIHAGTPATGVEITNINWFVAQGARGGRF